MGDEEMKGLYKYFGLTFYALRIGGVGSMANSIHYKNEVCTYVCIKTDRNKNYGACVVHFLNVQGPCGEYALYMSFICCIDVMIVNINKSFTCCEHVLYCYCCFCIGNLRAIFFLLFFI